MVKGFVEETLGWLSDPPVFWVVYLIALFCGFLLILWTIENFFLKKPLNAFFMGILFAAVMYFGIQWGKAKQPITLYHDTGLGVAPVSTWQCPVSHPIKARVAPGAGCVHYAPGQGFYNNIKPERCYANRDQARSDGCNPSQL